MIIWINGAFGSGKTQTAYALQHRLPRAFIYDPEEAGFYIRNNLPNSMQKPDFQEHPLWRSLVHDHLAYLAANTEDIIIVPMTITNPDYYKEIISRLRKNGHQVCHFVLAVSEETLLLRLAERGEEKDSWAAQQIPRCVQGLADSIFDNKLVTDNMSVMDVVEAIAGQTGILLRKNKNEQRPL